VTEKRLAEIAREDSRELLRALVSSIPDLVSLKDPQGAFLTCNARFESFIGVPEARIIGKTDHDFLLPEEASACIASDLAALSAAGSAVTEEELTFASDGHRELVQVIKTAVYDASGAQLGVLGIGRDITRIKQAEQELERHRHHLEDLVAERTRELMEARAEAERLSRAKGELLANMSHEIRTPLHAVLSLAYLLERRELSPEARDLVHKIHEAGRGLLGIINDVLDFSRLESNRIELERVPFQLDEVLGRLATIMTASTADKSIELVISPPACIDVTLLGACPTFRPILRVH
jgi:PAS domain S-box-containing protein